MAAITSAVIGLGTAVYGAVSQSKATSKVNKANKQVASNQAKAQQQSQIASDASIRAEALREQQMELEGLRRRRDVYRQAQAAQAQGVATAIAQGAATGDSSVTASRQGNRSQQTMDLLSNLQNIDIGRGIFAENRNITAANTKAASYSSTANQYATQAATYNNQANYYQGVMGFGLNLATAGSTINRVASTAATSAASIRGVFGGDVGINNWTTRIL